MASRRRSAPPAQQRAHHRSRGRVGAPARRPVRAHAVRHGDLALPPAPADRSVHARLPARGAVTFYSQRLLDKARTLGLDRRDLVGRLSRGQRGLHAARRSRPAPRWRAALGIAEPHVILNVKRLHELAGQRFLIDAFARLARARRDVRLVICGTGPLRADLEAQARGAGRRRSRHVHRPGAERRRSRATPRSPTSSRCRRCSRRCRPSPSRRSRPARRSSPPIIRAASSCTRSSATTCRSCRRGRWRSSPTRSTSRCGRPPGCGPRPSIS